MPSRSGLVGAAERGKEGPLWWSLVRPRTRLGASGASPSPYSTD